MKASELIADLEKLIKEHGDREMSVAIPEYDEYEERYNFRFFDSAFPLSDVSAESCNEVFTLFPYRGDDYIDDEDDEDFE